MFYTFSFYDIFLLYLHCLYLFSCSNKIKLKDFFCRMYVKTAILKWRTLMFWSLCLLWELNKWAENLLWRRLKMFCIIFLMNWKRRRNLWETKEMEDKRGQWNKAKMGSGKYIADYGDIFKQCHILTGRFLDREKNIRGYL